jgi:PAS domain S-box-containing protein
VLREYSERVVQARVHQSIFRERVLTAYEARCAVCNLGYRELLDAAHVKADAEGGQPVGPNGIAMCKIHHGAFDASILGVSPSYEIKIRHSEAQLRSILLTAPDVIMSVDRAGTISFINRTAPPLQPEDVIGSCAFDHVPPEARPRVVAAVEKVFSTRELDEYEVQGPPGPDNAREWWSVRAGPLIEGGEVVAATLCATNITQRKQSEEIEARLQEQLRQLQKLESIGRLAGGVAHDFNNLLTSILGFINLAQKRQPSGSPAIEFLEDATEAARRGAALTQQLLAFARKQIVHPTVVGINQIIEGMTPLLRRLVGENLDVKLSHAWHGDLVQPMTGFSILVCCPKGKLITQLKASTLEALRSPLFKE